MSRYADMNEVWQLVDELRDLRALRDLQAADVQQLVISAQTTQGPKTVTFKPADQGWSALLTRINATIVDRIAAIKTRLTALSVTELPT